ncbi:MULTISPECIES: hypothetical protein [Acinetobacter]|uniref:hypothetical protein n=1 Tax=Acinetobacter TaxID=469 RepID=UPI0039895C91
MAIAHDLKSQILNTLLAGKIISEHTHKEFFNTLRQTRALEEINETLHVLDRRCVLSTNNSAYFCVYSRTNLSKEEAEVIRKHFEESKFRLDFVASWAEFCRSELSNNSLPIQSGDIISYTDLLRVADESSIAKAKLADLIKRIKRNSTTIKDQVHSVLQYLVDQEYLVPTGNNGVAYLATGKWSVMYDELEFMCLHHNLSFDHPDPEQGELL